MKQKFEITYPNFEEWADNVYMSKYLTREALKQAFEQGYHLGLNTQEKPEGFLK